MKVLVYSEYKYEFIDEILYKGLIGNLNKNSIFLYAPVSTKLPAYFNNKLSQTIFGEDIKDKIDDFDLILFTNTALFDKYFGFALDRDSEIKRIFIDGVDDFFVRRIYKHPNINFYLKRELYDYIKPRIVTEWTFRYLIEQLKLQRKGLLKINNKWNIPISIANRHAYSKLRPFPLTVPNVNKQKFTKRRDTVVSFTGHFNNPDRKRYVATAQNLCKEFGLKNTEYYLSNYKREFTNINYINMLERSKLAMSIRGTGYDTFRYWEIPYHGAALLSQKIPIFIPNNFIDGESALYFDNQKELKSKIEKYAIKTQEWEEIAKKGNKLFLEHHTPEKRIKDLILKLIR